MNLIIHFHKNWDPISFVRGDPTQTKRGCCFFLVDEGRGSKYYQSGPSSVRKRNAIEMAFSWRADDGVSLADR